MTDKAHTYKGHCVFLSNSNEWFVIENGANPDVDDVLMVSTDFERCIEAINEVTEGWE